MKGFFVLVLWQMLKPRFLAGLFFAESFFFEILVIDDGRRRQFAADFGKNKHLASPQNSRVLER